MKYKHKRLYTAKSRDIRQIIDFYLNEENIGALNAYEKKRFKEFKHSFSLFDEDEIFFDRERKKFERFLGLTNSGLSSYNKRKKIGNLKIDSQGNLYLNAFYRKQRSKKFNYRDKDIVEILLDFDNFKQLADEFSLDSYLSEFTTDFYPDWVKRFKNSAGMSNMSNPVVIYWTEEILKRYSRLISTYGKDNLDEALINVKRRNYRLTKNTTPIEKEILNFLRKL